MLYPQHNAARLCVAQSGLWDFCLSHDLNAGDIDPAAPLPAARPMAVPASYNDQGEDKALRDHYGWAFYQRRITLPALCAGQRAVLRFGAVTHKAKVWLDGALIAEHKGGFLPFEADVTGRLTPGVPALLTVACDNRVDHSTLPVGNEPGQIAFFGSDNAGIPSVEHAKATAAPQNRPNFDFFNFAGIQRPVWLYTTPAAYIRDITLVPHNDGRVDYVIDTVGEGELSLEVLAPDGAAVASAKGGEGALRVPDPKLWEPWPGTPNLYTLRVSFGADEYAQTFGFREIRVDGVKVLLNGKPVMFTEYGADTVEGLHDTRAGMFSEEYQAEYFDRINAEIDKRPFFVGELLWNFADFATIQGPMRVGGNRKGVLTRDRRPKMAAHLLRRRWNAIPNFGYKP